MVLTADRAARTKACKDSFVALKKLIADLNANTQAALKAKAAHRDTAPYVRKQAELKKKFDTEYARAVKACAKR